MHELIINLLGNLETFAKSYGNLMDSDSSDDSTRMLGVSGLSAEKDSDWQDEESLMPFDNTDKVTALCHACQNFCHGRRETDVEYKHIRLLISLRKAAERGCQLCMLIHSKIGQETIYHRPVNNIQLIFMIRKPGSVGAQALEPWFKYVRVPKRAKYRDYVEEVKLIHLIPFEGMLSQITIQSFRIS